MFIGRHDDQRVLEVRLPRRLLPLPDLVQTLSADAPAHVGMKLPSSVEYQRNNERKCIERDIGVNVNFTSILGIDLKSISAAVSVMVTYIDSLLLLFLKNSIKWMRRCC